MRSGVAFLAFLLGTIVKQQSLAEDILRNDDAQSGWMKDKPGVRRLITLENVDQASNRHSLTSANSPTIVHPPEGAVLRTPRGFTIEKIAEHFTRPRALRVLENGDLFISDSGAGQILLLRKGSDGKWQRYVYADGLDRPFGMAVTPSSQKQRYFYIAEEGRIIRFLYGPGDVQAKGNAEVLLATLPQGGHWTRDIVLSVDGQTLYFSIGSASNVAENLTTKTPDEIRFYEDKQGIGAAWDEDTGRALVGAIDLNGRITRIFATGLRNCAGLTRQPVTNQVWCVVNERDELGDDLPPDFATSVSERAFYGWPWFYIGNHIDPRHRNERADLRGKSTVPDILLEAHSAPLGITFYTADQFPKEYRGDAFVAMHGSWNRKHPAGFKIVRLRFANNKPLGIYEDFVTGFVLDNDHVWGRPVGIAVGIDGTLFFSEDGNNSLWQVKWAGP